MIFGTNIIKAPIKDVTVKIKVAAEAVSFAIFASGCISWVQRSIVASMDELIISQADITPQIATINNHSERPI